MATADSKDRGTFGRWLKTAREAAGYTQEQAAGRAGISRITWARFETGAAVPKHRIPEIARAVLRTEGEALEAAGRLPAGNAAEPSAQADFGSRLRAAREAARLRVEDLAQATDVSVPAWVAYEAGRMVPGAETVRRACRALGVSADWLFGLAGNGGGDGGKDGTKDAW